MDQRKVDRREAIAVLGAAGAAFVAGCSLPSEPSSSGGTSSGGSTNAACAATPTETAGPFPSLTDLVRSDIREGRSGTPLLLTLTVVNTSQNCAPLENAQVEIWQCDAAGNYSQYGTQAAQTYLRGIQTTNASGQVTFTTIYPGWYAGRATHIHIEVTRNGRVLTTTQIAFPETTNAAVYTTGVYASRGSNPTSNRSDAIFQDSLASETATVSGDPASSLNGTFTVSAAG
jgi:protocatechuate 3,4-dioxygenase beta subunit